MNIGLAMEYSKEQLNYFRICYVVTDVLTEGLRIIFKQEWDNRYGATTSGEWKDEPRNGVDFKNKESAQNQKRNARLLTTMIGGNRAEWDCTMLFYAILYSDCIHSLSPVVRSNVDALRKFRNEDFAHMSEGNLSDLQFQNIIGKVDTAFQALGLSTMKIQEIKNQTSFPTEELKDVLKMVDDLKQELQEKERERQVLEDQLNNDISPFCVLPPKPSHDVTSRDREVAEIMQQLRELKTANKDRLSYLYISENPGSGKSQLAGLVAERFYKEIKDLPDGTSFVMTINCESPDTVIESYVAFSRHLKCPEYAVTIILHSDLTTNEKITNLRALIGTNIGFYTSWLLVLDNVTSLSNVHVYLPEAGNEMWARGQLLIITQDTGSIPLASPFSPHISISNGMHLGPEDVETANSYHKLGTMHEMLGDLSQAKDYHDRALEIRLKKLGPEHVDVASSYSHLGIVHVMLCDLSQAKDCHDRALAIRLKKLGPEHVDVASSYSHLGIVHVMLCDLSQAKDCHDRALAIRLKKLGPEHVDVASSYSHLGSVHKKLGDLSQAIVILYQLAL